MKQWSRESISRGTKCFSGQSESGYPGSYPVGFLRWLQQMGFWGDKRLHLCCGGTVDPDSDRVDIQEVCTPGSEKGHRHGKTSFKTTANIIADARDTGLPDETYDWIGIDPPYTSELAHDLYGVEEYYSSIDAFVREAYRLLKPGGLIMTLTYMPPKQHKDLRLVGCWMMYQNPPVRYYSGVCVWRKPGRRDLQGLEKWGVTG